MLKISPEEKKIYGRIMKLTGPIILQNLLSAFVSSADVIMLNFVGQEHISAVSLALVTPRAVESLEQTQASIFLPSA